MSSEADSKDQGQKIAIVRVRGVTGIKHPIDDTLNKLRLYRKNYCVVVPKNQIYIGMINKVKDYVTWGEVGEETYKTLLDERKEAFKGRDSDSKGKINYEKFSEIDGKKIKKFFRLNSPRKGYGRMGIKTPFINGGALGYREDKINDLIMRMI
ncbi:uL30 family ribosomal protein [Candidatus Woesearchaeota archaeon]|nr:uL30 family ribosomal protein [Candidatus Woesearchaeota archaeon]